jgi:hypothetical protein
LVGNLFPLREQRKDTRGDMNPSARPATEIPDEINALIEEFVATL